MKSRVPSSGRGTSGNTARRARIVCSVVLQNCARLHLVPVKRSSGELRYDGAPWLLQLAGLRAYSPRRALLRPQRHASDFRDGEARVAGGGGKIPGESFVSAPARAARGGGAAKCARATRGDPRMW